MMQPMLERDRGMISTYLDFAAHVKVEQVLFLFKECLDDAA